MKNLDAYITEKILINKNTNIYSCHPKNKAELREILVERLKEDKNANLNDIDVSGITDMGTYNTIFLFEDLDPHNIDISKWNVSNVTNTDGMFFKCQNFNCDLSQWDVSNVTHMANMFYGCQNFNCDLSQWDVSNVTNMFYMFHGCKSLKNIPSWYKE